MAGLTITTVQPDDLDAILRVEQSWHPQGRASRDKFVARIEKFAQGFFLAKVDAPGGVRTVATICAMPLHYDPAQVGRFSDWATVTNDGYYPDGLTDAQPCRHGENSLYIVSGIIERDYRGRDLFAPMVERVVTQARRLGMRYVLAGAVLPGYRRYCEQHGDIAAYAYCRRRRGRSLVDPLLAMYEKLAFELPAESHVLPEYFPDDASRNHAALVVRHLHRSGGDRPV